MVNLLNIEQTHAIASRASCKSSLRKQGTRVACNKIEIMERANKSEQHIPTRTALQSSKHPASKPWFSCAENDTACLVPDLRYRYVRDEKQQAQVPNSQQIASANMHYVSVCFAMTHRSAVIARTEKNHVIARNEAERNDEAIC